MSENQTVITDNGMIPTSHSVWIKLLGPNYKLRIAGYLNAVNEWVLYLAVAPYALGTAGIILPAWLKEPLFFICGVAKVFLSIRQVNLSKQRDVSGTGTVSAMFVGLSETQKLEFAKKMEEQVRQILAEQTKSGGLLNKG